MDQYFGAYAIAMGFLLSGIAWLLKDRKDLKDEHKKQLEAKDKAIEELVKKKDDKDKELREIELKHALFANKLIPILEHIYEDRKSRPPTRGDY